MSTVRRVGGEGVQRALARLTTETNQLLKVRAFAMRDSVTSVLERSSTSGSGVLYPGARNRSSAPGEPPARQSGKLINSIQASRVNEGLYEVGPRAATFPGPRPYPVILEFGGVSAARAPRPFMRVAIAEFKRDVR